jgi:NTP pyrophosphatase (non-canonical NTP hydrolase)
MTLDEYQNYALSTAIFPRDNEHLYLTVALCEEAGEVAGKVKKTVRDLDGDFEASRLDIAMELGDVLWYAATLAHTLGYTLQDVADMNYAKIESRKRRHCLHGSGDNR